MVKKIPLDVLDPNIEKISQRCTLLYGIDTKLLVDRMNKISAVLLDYTLPKNKIMETCFENEQGKDVTKILINPKHCRFINNILISFLINQTPFEELIHELLHIASKSNLTNGLLMLGDEKYFALNEGVTQMFADDICESDEKSYSELKLFAKVLRNTYGNKIMCEAYFIDSNILRNKFYESTKDFSYYDTFNKTLTELYKFARKYEGKPAFILMYERKINVLLKDLLAKIVTPYIDLLTAEEKNTFIENLLLDTNNNETIRLFFEPEHGLK